MRVDSFLRYAIVLGLALVLPTPARAEIPADDHTCYPLCRPGYFCQRGKCLERCNPSCKTDEQCTDAGVCAPSTAMGTFVGPQRWDFGVKPGVFTPTDFALHGLAVFPSEVGFVLDAAGFFHLASMFDLGLYVKYARTSTVGSSVNIVSTGLRFRFPIQVASRMQIRFGGGFGVNVLTGDRFPDSGYGIDPFADLDFVFGVSRNVALVVGYSFISQPWGAYKNQTLSFWPASCVGIGIEVGR